MSETAPGYVSHSSGLESPALYGAVVTPNDSTDIAHAVRAIRVATAGDLAVMWRDGTTLTILAVQVGEILPIRVRRVLATGTTATGIVALW